jgi:multisubunit Na+/H+ antiporter MnhE subunit
MLLGIHIVVAVIGLIVASIAFARPSLAKIQASYGLLVGTLLSGSLLIIVANASILRTCTSGLLYTAVMYFGIAAAKAKLAKSVTYSIDPY